MTRGFAVVLTLLVLSAAWTAAWWSTLRTEYFPKSLWHAASDCDPALGEPPYSGGVMDDFSAGWYGSVLSGFQEPSLYRRSGDARRSVRFTWIRSFDDPIIVRIDRLADGSAQLTAKQRPLGLGLSPGTRFGRYREVSRTLTPAEAVSAEAAVSASRLFKSKPGSCSCCTDGARWIIEGADPEIGYRFRDVQSPQVGSERELGLFLLGLTGWDVEPIY